MLIEQHVDLIFFITKLLELLAMLFSLFFLRSDLCLDCFLRRDRIIDDLVLVFSHQQSLLELLMDKV